MFFASRKEDRSNRPLTHMSDVPMSPTMAAYSDFLDDVYENITIDSKGGPTPSTEYTNLAVVKKEEVKKEKADEFMKATLHSGIDEIVNEKKAIKLKDIFKPDEGQARVKLVLVEGAPGVGKSTFTLEICRRRHEVEAMRAFSAVVLLRLREKEVQEAKSLADLIKHTDPDIQPDVAGEMHSNRGENTLFVLDGFDEVPVPVRKSFFLAKVISGMYLTKATVLVTSRPSAREDLISLRKPHKHVEILGFTSMLIEQYARNIFGSDTTLLSNFLKYISTNAAIKSLMYVPLNTAIVVGMYREDREVGRPIPQTMTQLYCELTLTRMSRHLKGTGNTSVDYLPEKLEDLHQEHPEVHKQFLSLAKLAFEGTLKQEVIFKHLPAGCSTLGLMTTSQQIYKHRASSPKHNFFHLTVQEFLSAYYISQLPGSEQKETFEQYADECNCGHMDVVWQFVAGLTGFGGIGWEVVESRKGRDRRGGVSPFLVQCLYEAQGKADCESVLGRSKVKYSNSSCVLDCFALGYCIAVSRCTWQVVFRKSSLGTQLLEMLLCGLSSQEEVCGTIDTLVLTHSHIGREGMAHVKEMPRRLLQQLSHLDMFYCRLDGTALDLLSEITRTMTSLEYLNIGGNPAGDGGMVKLLQTLATTSHLHTLHMRGVTIGCEDVVCLSHLIRPSGSIKNLVIGDKRMQRDCVKLLLKTVLSPSSLEHLTLWSMDMTPLSLAPLKGNCNITTLEFKECTLGSEDISCIAEALHTNSTLTTLGIGEQILPVFIRSDTSQTTDTLRDLSKALKVNRSLKELLVSLEPDSVLRREGVRALVGAFQYNRTLERLKLCRHCREHFSPAELTAMDSNVLFLDF